MGLHSGMLLLLMLLAIQPVGAVNIGPFTFDSAAFADTATQLDAGTISPLGCTTVQNCLTGYSPDAAIVNTGFGGNANLFELDFTDLMAVNGAGPDIVFFSARFSEDPWAIAVRPQGGSFTSFVDYAVGDSLDMGVTAVSGSAELFGLPIDLDSFGLGSGAVVDAIQFKALPNAAGATEGDAVMAGVLSSGAAGVPEPGTLGLLAAGLGLGLILGRARRGLSRHKLSAAPAQHIER